jgi:hypothetical protein
VQDLEEAGHQLGEAVSCNAAVCCLRGKAFEEVGNSTRAAAAYTAALRCDPYCYEAFQVLQTSYHMHRHRLDIPLISDFFLPFNRLIYLSRIQSLDKICAGLERIAVLFLEGTGNLCLIGL